MPAQKIKAYFTEPMLLLPNRTLPEGANWAYELKLDGYRALAVKTDGKVHVRSRNNKDFNTRYRAVAKALAALPDETVIDGEVVALDESGRPSFSTLQNHSSANVPIVYYVFDVLILAGRNVMPEPLSVRRDLLRTHILPKLGEPIRHCPELNASLAAVIESVRAAGLEGVVAKSLDSAYEPGSRSGAWRKMRINRGQEFVIARSSDMRRPLELLLCVLIPFAATLARSASAYGGTTVAAPSARTPDPHERGAPPASETPTVASSVIRPSGERSSARIHVRPPARGPARVLATLWTTWCL